MQKKSNSGGGSLKNNSSKAKKVLIVSLTLGLTIGIGVCATDKYLSPNKKLNDKTIAMYIQNEEGAYTASTENTFPTDGYVLNVEKSNCRNGGTITQDSRTKKISLTASKTDTCTLYFDKVLAPTAEQTLAKLKLSSQGKIAEGEFDKISITDETANGLYEMEDDYGTSYYFRGAVENNYVKFGKNKSDQDMYWRIIRINGDGSLRIIYDGTNAHANGESNEDRVALTNVAWNTNPFDAKYVGYMYGGANGEASTSKEQAQTNETDSNIKTQLDTWYKENIVDTGYSNAVSDTLFCNDRSTPGKDITGWSNDTGLGYAKNVTTYGAFSRYVKGNYFTEIKNKQLSFKCNQKNDAFTVKDTVNGNGALTYPVGQITADEIGTAGGHFNNLPNTKYYLYKSSNSSYWTMSPFNFDSSHAYVFSFRTVLSNLPTIDITGSNKNNSAPVINLSPEYASTLVGTGTMTDPYRAP